MELLVSIGRTPLLPPGLLGSIDEAEFVVNADDVSIGMAPPSSWGLGLEEAATGGRDGARGIFKGADDVAVVEDEVSSSR